MICEFRLPTINLTKVFEPTEWSIGSTAAATAGFAPAAEGPTIDAGRISIPLTRISKNGKIIERCRAVGWGVGIGVSAGLQIPFVDFQTAGAPIKSARFGASGSTSKMPGAGSRIYAGLGLKDQLKAQDWAGGCLVISGTAALSGLAASPSIIVFLSRSCMSLALPPEAQVALVRGVAFCYGLGIAAAVGSVAADSLAYDLQIKDDLTTATPGNGPRFVDWDIRKLTFKDWDRPATGVR